MPSIYSHRCTMPRRRHCYLQHLLVCRATPGCDQLRPPLAITLSARSRVVFDLGTNSSRRAEAMVLTGRPPAYQYREAVALIYARLDLGTPAWSRASGEAMRAQVA